MSSPLAVVIPTMNRHELLRHCLESLHCQSPSAVNLVVVDSSDCTACCWLAREYPGVNLLRNESNAGFANAVNHGIRATDTPWIVLLNDDAVAAPNWLEELLAIVDGDERIGAVASRMMFLDHRNLVSSAGIRVDASGGAWDLLVGQASWPNQPVEVFGVSGGACLLRREMLDDIGLFQEDFFAYLEDVDLAWRMRARGWKAVLAPDAVVYHAVSSTAGEGSAFKRYYLARNKWRVIVRNYPRRGLADNLGVILAYDALSIAKAIAHGDPVPLRGRIDSLRDMPRLVQQRRAIQARTTVSWPELRAAMSPLESPVTLYRRGRLVSQLASKRRA